jgi:hypothetical protein
MNPTSGKYGTILKERKHAFFAYVPSTFELVDSFSWNLVWGFHTGGHPSGICLNFLQSKLRQLGDICKRRIRQCHNRSISTSSAKNTDDNNMSHYNLENM